MLQQRVDHDVAGEMDLRWVHSFALEILIGIAACREKNGSQRVGDEAIDLFRHRAIETAESGLDVRHGNEKLRRDNRTRHRGIDVAHHDHQVRFLPQTDLLELHHDPRGLLGMTAGAHAKAHVGNRNAKIAKEDIRHAFVVVLSRVDENAVQAGRLLHLFDDGRNLHKVGPCAHDVQDFHANIP